MCFAPPFVGLDSGVSVSSNTTDLIRISLGSGAVCLAHCDGSNTWTEVSLLVKAVNSLNGSKEGR